MSRRYWLPILAVVGLILAAQQAAQAQGRQGSATQSQRAPQAQSQPTVVPALQDSLNRIGTALEAQNKKGEASEDKRKAEEDRQAQFSMAQSARQMFIVGMAEAAITFAGVMLVLATLIYTRHAAKAAQAAVTEAKEATKATREIGEAQVRAYLTTQDSKFSVGATYFDCYPTFRNSGQSPARNITVRATGFVLDGNITKTHRLARMATDCNPIVAGGLGNGRLEFSGGGKVPNGVLLSDNAFFIVDGDVEWEDVFGKKQTLNFTLIQIEKGEAKPYRYGMYREGKLSAGDNAPRGPDSWNKVRDEYLASEGKTQEDEQKPPRPLTDSGL